ncbi:MAG TPA: TetR/AcrR family transcriptional regulator [bacterium]|nr:TetR/AcrR family transcriptional regulator [bacterium]
MKSSKAGHAKNHSKSEFTRRKILRAARKVFADHPYRAASIRMIGKAGGFDHPLIRYYFPNKGVLFERVVAEICEEFYAANISWFEGLERLGPREGLSLYLDRLLDYNFKRPEALRIILINSPHIDRFEEIPGYQKIPEVLAKTRRTFEEKTPLRASPDQIGIFINSFNSLLIYYLGASSCQAQILGLDPDSESYRAWVKDALLYVFLPLLEKLIFPDTEAAPRGRSN